MKRSTTLVIVSVVVLLFAGHAEADGKNKTKAKAAQFFARGEILFDSGDYAKAAEAFQLAYDLAPHPMVLANIAMSYDKAGKVVEAIEFYEKYVADLEDKKERRQVESRLQELSSKVGELSIACPSASCRIEVDGVERGQAPVSITVEVGLHRVEAYVGEEKVAAVDTRVVSGEISTVELFQRDQAREEDGATEVAGPELEEPVSEPSSDDPVEPDSGEGPRLGPGFWISTGVTVAAGAVTVVFGVMAMKDKEDFDATGGTDRDLKEKGERDQLVTNVMIGVTAAAAVSAVAFLIADLRSGGEEEKAVAIAPGPGAGLAIVGEF